MAATDRISNIYRYNNHVSFEVFPPNTNQGLRHIFEAVYRLSLLNPDFFSITYGAGGSTTKRSIEVASAILHLTKNICIPHFTCTDNTKEEVLSMLDEFKKQAITGVLALRGDVVDKQKQGDFKYAIDLVRFIREICDLDIIVAGYPEGHVEAKSKQQDWVYLKEKIQAGGNAVITQLSFDNQYIYEFHEYLRQEGITIPIIIGIFPLSNITQLDKILKLTNVAVPKKLADGIKKYSESPSDFYAFATDYAIYQVEDLLQNGITNYHFYTMNRAEQTIQILSTLKQYFPTLSLI